MTQRNTPWGIFLLGPLGDQYCMVRAACYVSARALANAEIGSLMVDGERIGWDSAPAEVVGDALVDAFPRILLKTTTKPNLVPVEERGKQGTDEWLYTFLGYGVRRALDGAYNVETLTRSHWCDDHGSLASYGATIHREKDSIGIFQTYDEARDMLTRITGGQI